MKLGWLAELVTAKFLVDLLYGVKVTGLKFLTFLVIYYTKYLVTSGHVLSDFSVGQDKHILQFEHKSTVKFVVPMFVIIVFIIQIYSSKQILLR